MKLIPLGLQCSVPRGIYLANMRSCSYPVDWLWSPSKTTYNILSILIDNGVEKALEYMTSGHTYYQYLGNERYISVNYNTESQMNANTGLGNTHYIIDNEYKSKVRRRLTRLLNDVKSNENIVFIYADAANPDANYYLDDIEYGLDATEYLLKIHDLIYPINNNIKILYFCWNERKKENGIIEYIPFDFVHGWFDVSEIIKDHLSRL